MLDFEEDYLISLCVDYRDSFDKLNRRMDETGLTKEYGRGGSTLHRGFYCPSPVKDIIVGGCDRGRLVHKPKSDLPVDYVYFKKEGKLLIADNNAFRSDNTFFLDGREFIVDNNQESIGLSYNMTWNTPRLSFISLCRYDSTGKIKKYLTMLPRFTVDDGKFIIYKKEIDYYCEQYSYNEQTGLLESVVNGSKYDKYISEDFHRFFHDETGRLLSYQYRKTNGEYTHVFMIAKRKRRMV